MFECPECGKFTIEVNVYTENYGADADGNRGMMMTFAEFESQECDCELSESDIDKICEEAVEDYR